MQESSPSELVRRCFAAWETRDKAALESILADDFTFSSPNDDHINLSEYWSRCWAAGEVIRGFRILTLLEKGNEAVIRYECELKDGARFQNMEHFRVEGNKIRAVEVYFGRSLAPARSA